MPGNYKPDDSAGKRYLREAASEYRQKRSAEVKALNRLRKREKAAVDVTGKSFKS